MNRADAKRIALAAALKCEEITVVYAMASGQSVAVTSRPIRAKVTRLTARWTCELDQDLQMYYSLRAPRRLKKLLAAELLSAGINAEVYDKRRRKKTRPAKAKKDTRIRVGRRNRRKAV